MYLGNNKRAMHFALYIYVQSPYTIIQIQKKNLKLIY